MKKFLIIIVLVLFSFNLKSEEVFLKCNYSGEDFKPSAEFAKQYTPVKPKIKIGVPKIIFSINVSKKIMKIISEGENDVNGELPINFETDSVYMFSQRGDPSIWDKKYKSDEIDFSMILAKPKESYNLDDFPFTNFKSFGVSFDSFKLLDTNLYYSINKFNLDLKILVHIKGLDFKDRAIIIGSHYYRYSCEKIEEQL